MKNYISAVLFLVFVCLNMHANAQLAQKGEDDFTKYEQAYPDGEIKARFYFDSEFRRVSKWTTYYKNGNVNKEFTYHRDMLDGDYKIYLEDRHLICLMQFTDGKLNGEFVVWNIKSPSDTIIHGQYNNGEKVGQWFYYLPYPLDNHNLKKGKWIGNYIKDKFDGNWTKYDANGNKAYEMEFKNDEAESFISYSNEKIEAKGKKVSGKLEGEIYNESGEAISDGATVNRLYELFLADVRWGTKRVGQLSYDLREVWNLFEKKK